MKESYDCIVVGGGIGGVSASLTLAREGLSVLLVEKQCILGGLATSGLINWYEPLCNGKGRQLIFGNAEEILILAARYGATLDTAWINKGQGTGRYATFFNHNIFAISLTCLLEKVGVDITFDTLFTGVNIKNKKIESVKLNVIEGEKIINCKYVVDATGNGQVFALCSLPLHEGKNYLSFYVHKAGKKDSNLYLREWDIYGSNMVGNGQPKEVPLLCGNTSKDINDYIINSHKIFYKSLKEENRENDITSIPHMPQFRMIRSIVGEKTIDNSCKNVKINESVGVFGYFSQSGNYFEIPYGCLYNKKIANLFAVGRIISALDEGWDASRVIPVCAQTGDIVGNAISILLKDNCKENYNLSVKLLQDKLLKKGHKLNY